MVRWLRVGLAAAPPALRATRWTPLLAALLVGYAMLGVPVAATGPLDPLLVVVLLRLAALCAGLGIGFLFDDPARPTTETVPSPAWLPLAARVAGGGVLVAGWWWATLATAAVAAGPAAVGLPRGDLTLEAATVAVVVLAVATVVWRRAARGTVGLVAAPAFLAAAFAAGFLPDRVALLVALDHPAWSAAHDRWAALLGAAALATVVGATWSPPHLRRRRAIASPDARAS
ncbi:hypothetical protein O7635_29885 [Asanoa sp. WMMD1127]|uniref:hypothetical protein n=1 Tax=Asanoa sp. WMMD1127 TaxID=3016107 RepID=UPI002415BBFF|nr:hypothetical protein [Asanoa sp. WMMD1127]MDG4826080.1 hypothetical protein [Asanoa sp. WMMD1127]